MERTPQTIPFVLKPPYDERLAALAVNLHKKQAKILQELLEAAIDAALVKHKIGAKIHFTESVVPGSKPSRRS